MKIEQLIELGKEKDPGLFEVYLAGMMRQVSLLQAETLPEMLKPIGLEEMKKYFLILAEKLIEKK